VGERGPGPPNGRPTSERPRQLGPLGHGVRAPRTDVGREREQRREEADGIGISGGLVGEASQAAGGLGGHGAFTRQPAAIHGPFFSGRVQVVLVDHAAASCSCSGLALRWHGVNTRCARRRWSVTRRRPDPRGGRAEFAGGDPASGGRETAGGVQLSSVVDGAGCDSARHRRFALGGHAS
jgi:hypothetical protein